MSILALRRLARNTWLAAGILFGLIVAVALFSSIPMYSQAVLQRLLDADLRRYQSVTGEFPGSHIAKKGFWAYGRENEGVNAYPAVSEALSREVSESIALPVLETVRRAVVPGLFARSVSTDGGGAVAGPGSTGIATGIATGTTTGTLIKLEMLSELTKHVVITHGRPFAETNGEVVEAMITEEALKRLDVTLGNEYRLWDPRQSSSDSIRCKIVGVFTIEQGRDLYWYKPLTLSRQSVFVREDDLLANLDAWRFASLEAEWYHAFDYRAVTVSSLSGLLRTFELQKRLMDTYNVSRQAPMIDILERYEDKRKTLRLTMLFLETPMMLLLAFFIFMVSYLIIENEETETAVLKSRGASSFQIFLIHVTSGTLLCLGALAVGPPLGYFVCAILGSSSGFLQFSNRVPLPLELGLRTYGYASLASLFFLATMLAPALAGARTTIVVHKRRRSRDTRRPAWERFFIDVLLLTVSAYGLYSYQIQRRVIELTGVAGAELPIDPLFFFMSVLFMVGGALFFLRLFPYLVAAIRHVGRPVWGPELHVAFVHLGRSKGYERFVLVFLAFTVATGVYNASSARTTNKHAADRIRYETGADVVLHPLWWSARSDEDLVRTAETRVLVRRRAAGSVGDGEQKAGGAPAPLGRTREPEIDAYRDLDGVSAAARVMKKEDVTVFSTMGHSIRTDFMALVPHEFGTVAWFRSDLLGHHLNDYLNLMAERPDALLVSASLREQYNLEAGQVISVFWPGQDAVEGVVYGFVDYWPTYNPFSGSGDGTSAGARRHLVIANLDYVQARMSLEPYVIWVKRDPAVPRSDFYSAIASSGLEITEIHDANRELEELRRRPEVQGTNGVLTLSFLISLGVSLIGLVIAWLVSLQARVLQFGVMRALGMSTFSVFSVVGVELILVCAAAVGAGLLVGGAAGQLFVPVLYIVGSAADRVPPFQIGAFKSDYRNLMFFVSAMLAAAWTGVAVVVSRIRMHQAVKLGEE